MKNKKTFIIKFFLMFFFLLFLISPAYAIVSEDGCQTEETACTKDGQSGHCRAYESFGEERIGCYVPVIREDGCVNEEDSCVDAQGISGHCRQYESFGYQYMGCYTVSSTEGTNDGTPSGTNSTSSSSSNNKSSSTSKSGLVIPATGLPSPSGGIRAILVNVLVWILGIFGMLAILAFVVSGIQYFAAAGDEKMMETAKKNLVYSVIGVIVALSGFVIIQAIDSALRGYSAVF